MGLKGHPLYNMLRAVKNTRYHLRRKSTVKPKVNTKRFMCSFVNRLIFKYELVLLFHQILIAISCTLAYFLHLQFCDMGYVCLSWFSHDVTKIQTTKLSILLNLLS